MKLNKFKKIIDNTTPAKRELISKNMDILERIHELLDLKFEGKQKLLAEKMGKTEAEISKLLSGIQNYTMQTVIKFEVAFGAPILSVHTGKDIANANFVQAKMNECFNQKDKVPIETPSHFETGDYKISNTYSSN